MSGRLDGEVTIITGAKHGIDEVRSGAGTRYDAGALVARARVRAGVRLHEVLSRRFQLPGCSGPR